MKKLLILPALAIVALATQATSVAAIYEKKEVLEFPCLGISLEDSMDGWHYSDGMCWKS